MISTPTTQLLGPANSFADYEGLTSGWALGTAWDSGRWSDPLNWLERSADQTVAGQGIRRPDWRSWTPSKGPLMVEPDTALLDPKDANERYGITGALSWDKPVREGEAKLLRQWKIEEIRQADILARSTPGALPATARFFAGMAGGNSDPLSIGSNFVPVLQEARWAQLAGVVGKVGVRVIRGAAEGAAGAVLTEPFALYQAGRQQADYDASDSALNLAFGLVAGAGLRTIGGAGGDLWKRWRSSPIEIRDAAVNQAAAALVTGTPVRTDELLNTVTPPETIKAAALRVGDQVFTGLTHGDAFEKALAAGVSEDALGLASRDSGFVTSTGRYVGREEALPIAQASGQKYRRVGNAVTSQGTTAPTIEELRAARAAAPEKALDAIAFIQSKGGIKDTEGHDLRNMLGQRQNPRTGVLLRESGHSVDDIGEMLHEAGYFGDPAVTPRPTEAEVVDFLREAGDRKLYSVKDTGAALDAAKVDPAAARDMAAGELDREAGDMGVTVGDAERAAALDLMLSDGVSASDALDHVLERAAIEGGVFTSTAQRLADVESRLARAQDAGAPLHALAPLLDERASLQADLAAERLPALGETIKSDLRGDTPGSLDADGAEASRVADQDAKEALPVTEALQQAKQAAMNAEAQFHAVAGGGDLLPAERAAMDAEIAHAAAKRQAAMSLAGCMIREGV